MTKDEMEVMCRKNGLNPVLREKIGNYDLFVADGFSSSPHFRYQKFGVEPGEFPTGMFVTLWWLGRDEKNHIGRPMFMEPTEFKLEWRINAARKDAKKALKKLRKSH